MKYILAILLHIAMVPIVCAAPSLEDYGQLRATQLMSLSPDGKHLAFRKVKDGSDMAIVMSLDTGKMVSAVDLSEITPHEMYFLNNDTLVVVVSDYRRISGFVGVHEVSTASAINIKTGRIQQLLTPGDNIYKGQTGLGRIYGVSPDQKYVFMPAFVGESRHDHSPNKSLMRVELDNPKRPKEWFKGTEHSIDFFVDDLGNPIIHERLKNRKNQHLIEVIEGKSKRKIYEHVSEIPEISTVGLTADRQYLVVLNELNETGRRNYYLMSLEDGEMIDAGYGREDADVESVFKDQNRVVLGLRYSGMLPSYRFFDERLDSLMKTAMQTFPDQYVALRSWTEDKNSILVLVSGFGAPDDYYLFRKGHSPKFLASGRPNIKSEDVHPLGKIRLKVRDDYVIPTILTIPKDHVNNLKQLPAVVMPHGGPASYDRAKFNFFAQAFAEQGYLVIQPQFRGSAGFGLEHKRAGWGEWGGVMQNDVTDVLKYFIKKDMVDGSKVCIVGASYGGYSALAGGGLTPELYRCVVSIAGVADLPRMLKQEKMDHGRDHWVVSYWEKAMANGKVDKSKLKEISPVNMAESFRAPVLLIHGVNDKIVPIKQSKVMLKALKKAKKDVKLIKLKSENHHLMKGETRLKALEETVKFVNAHLK